MRICFCSDFHTFQTGDIGTKSVARALAAEITKKHTVFELDVRDLLRWKTARAFRPDILHFVLAPTTSGFLIVKLFSVLSGRSKVVISAPNPTLSHGWLLSHLKPDLILTQARESHNKFEELGFKTSFLPNGVDLNRFNPPPPGTKETLRDKYGIERGQFVILHVGPIIRKRNVERMSALHDADTRILLVGREGADPTLRAELRQNGFQIFDRYLADIQELYALSDCYVFPTPPANRGASIEMPLSVLEAMACDLPIVSTAFGALPRVFNEGDGFFFAETTNDIYARVEQIRRGDITTSTRHKVLPYSWEGVSRMLEERYNELTR